MFVTPYLEIGKIMNALRLMTLFLGFIFSSLPMLLFAANNHLHAVSLPALDKRPALVQKVIKESYQPTLTIKDSAAIWGEYAMTLMANGIRDEAIPALQNAHTLDPKNYRWPYLIAFSLLEDSGEKALKYALIAQKIKPDAIDVLYLMAQSYESVGDVKAAINVLQKTAKLAPENAAINYLLGQLLFTAKEYEKSKQYLIKTSQLAPSSKKVKDSLVRLSRLVKIEKTLLARLEKTAKNDADITYKSDVFFDVLSRSRMPQNLSMAASMNMRSRNWAAAESQFSMLEKYYSLSDQGLADYALVLTVMQKYGQAEDRYKVLIKKNPKDLRIRLSLADLLFMNRKISAETHYQWLLENATSNAYKSEALQGLGRMAASNGDLKGALKLLKQAVKLNAKSSDMQIDLVRIYADMKDFDKAFFHLAEAEKLGGQVDRNFKARLKHAQEQSSR